ncbi:sensor domain-containing protein [Halorubrum trapanicum]|uniref:sensor domain-containing protein n=1 Tax=Halorubrum trapanicum TaxID=29284 RepID=UPI003C6F7D6A
MVSLRPLAALPVVGVIADGRTYRHLLYLLIAVPLGFLYSGIGSFALVFGVLLSVVIVGVGLLIAAVVGSRLVAGLERWLANRLLGTDLVAADDLPAAADDGGAGAVATVRAYLSTPSTWRGLGFVSLKFWVTVAAVAPLAVLANALPLVAAPLRYPYATQFGEVNGEPAVWAIDTAPEAALAAGVGVVGVLVGLHLTNLIAGGARLMAVALLGDEAGGDAGDGSDADRVTVDRDDDGSRESGADDRDGDDPDNDGDRDGNDSGGDRGKQSDEDPELDADSFEFDADPADPETDPDDRG